MDPADLYGLPLDGFVSARGELARALRADGRRDEAQAVAGLRKPSVAAWVVNQLVRARPRDAAELFAAGDALRDAQAALVGGRGDRDALRGATERERAAVAELVETAGGLLSPTGAGPGAAVLDRVAETLHAAALDDAARAQVADGTLARELRHVGLGGAVAAEPEPVRPTKPKRVAAAPDRQAERDRAARERAEADRRERDRAEARRTARVAESAARRELERTDRAVRHAQDLRERAVQALAAAETDLARARERADAAAAAHRRATARLEDA